MEINNNIPQYQSPYVDQNRSLERIATGLELNKASDNASALSIADNLRTEANGYTQALENTNSAIASVQIADSAISEQSKILDNIKEKLLQASTDTTSQEGREALLQDIQNSLKGFDAIASSTNYNSESLLQASSTNQDATTSQAYQIGTESSNTIDSTSIQSNSVGVGLNDLLTEDGTTFTSQDAREYLSKVDDAIGTLNNYRADLGTTQNQLASTGKNIISQEIQTRAAQAELTAANIAQEVTNFDKSNVLSQVGAYTQSQFNITQQSVLRLLT
ncbi:flagellin [Malaciobacter halophilus]|uniref:Flagellin n=1 Tax=Malaciobacter halophilus TaxID=197482 RepID=A0A2N1J2Q4_9BACT|nr:flagellin [Malaciobacter halophilus]AXH09927.1 putative flagellar protein [Malaciobacter halophilus]PKI80752.1 flagellin [Malaciobacter halophilus]